MEFCSAIDTFLGCITNQVISEKLEGNTEGTDTDSISRICTKAFFWGHWCKKLFCVVLHCHAMELHGKVMICRGA